MGGKGEGWLPFRKKEVRDSNTKGASGIQLFFMEARGAHLYALAPNHPMRAQSSPPF